MNYDSAGYHIHHNSISNSAGGVFLKGVQQAVDMLPGSIHHNAIVDCRYPVALGGVGQNTVDSTIRCNIYQNLFNGGEKFLLIAYNNTSPVNISFVNNTIVNLDSTEALFAAYAGATDANTRLSNSLVQNNLFAPIDGYLWQDSGATTAAFLATRMPFDRNMYDGVTGYFKNGTFAAWQAAGMDANGAQDDPEFTNALTGDYTLGASSPALDFGVDVLNLLGNGTTGSINAGCYILPDQSDQIGPRAA